MKHQVIGATEFKAKCLALLDQLQEQGGEITVTKRGKPVATVLPAKKRAWKSPKDSLKGSSIPTDNVDLSDLWEINRQD